jgi:hypothetical protein
MPMAKNPEAGKTPEPERKPPQAERSVGQGREDAQELGTPASSGAPVSPVSPRAPASKETAQPMSPREFIHRRMRELDKKGS